MDKANHPAHYNQGDIECIDAIRASMTLDQFRGFLKGNIIKYTWRFENKGGEVDIEKAAVYLEWLKQTYIVAEEVDPLI